MNNLFICCVISLVTFQLAIVNCQRGNLNNTCIDAKHHKSAPGPEDNLHKQCTPWNKRSCCTSETSVALHEDSLYSLDYDHCSGRKPMSEACKRHFTQDHCFYECSPNTGPWIVQEPNRSWRRERFYGVPLCAADCDAWFNDCSRDYTCTDNWSRNFDWVTMSVDDGVDQGEGKRCRNNAPSCRVNVCPKGSSCATFAHVFGNSSNFCEKVWDGSWLYTPNDQPCMRLWFNATSGNPNDAVSHFYDYSSLTSAAASATCTAAYVTFGALVMLLRSI